MNPTRRDYCPDCQLPIWAHHQFGCLTVTHSELITRYQKGKWASYQLSPLVRRGTAVRLGLTHKRHDLYFERVHEVH